MPSEAEVVCSADGKFSLSFNLSVNLPVEGLIDQLLSLSQRSSSDNHPLFPDHQEPPRPADPFLQTPLSALRAEDVAYREYLARGRIWPVVGDFFVKTAPQVSVSSPAKLRTASAASTAFSARPAPPPGLAQTAGARPRALSEASCLTGGADNFAAASCPQSDARSRALTMNHWAPPCEENSGEFPIQSQSECKQM